MVVCRDAKVAARRFGIPDSTAAGTIVTRTGRPFFSDPAHEAQLLTKVVGEWLA